MENELRFQRQQGLVFLTGMCRYYEGEHDVELTVLDKGYYWFASTIVESSLCRYAQLLACAGCIS